MFGYLFSEMYNLSVENPFWFSIQYEFLSDAILVWYPDTHQSIDQVKSKSSQVITPADWRPVRTMKSRLSPGLFNPYKHGVHFYGT